MFFSAGHAAAQNSDGGAAPVRIVNPIPVPVTGNVLDVGRGTPFTLTSPKTSEVGEPPEVVFSLQVPAGHLAVVEHISVRASVCAAGTISLQDFTLRAGSKTDYLIPVRVVSTYVTSLMVNEQTKFVVEPGETMSVETENYSAFSPGGCGPATLDATISGVIIPAS